MRQFFTQTTKTRGNASLYTRVDCRGVTAKIKTGLTVSIEKWNPTASGRAYDERKYFATTEGKSIEPELCKVSRAIDNVLTRPEFDREDIKEAVYSVTLFQERKALEEAQLDSTRKQKEAERRRRDVVVDSIKRCIEGIENGDVRLKGQDFKSSTINGRRYTYELVRRYNEYFKRRHGHDLRWSDINAAMSADFVDYMEKKERFMVSTINQQTAMLKCFMRWSYENGDHDNTSFTHRDVLPARRILDTDMRARISLSSQEVEALYQMPLEGLQERVRDVFLCGVYTCQRFSDYGKLTKKNFCTTARGTRGIRLVQQKTGTMVFVPQLTPHLEEIAKRYDYNLPRLSKTTINIVIKEICEKLSESVPSLAELVPTRLMRTQVDKEKKERGSLQRYESDGCGRVLVPRHQLVSSHSARRTGLTLLFLSRKFNDRQLMSISGHRTSSMLTKYLRMNEEEMADNIMESLNEAGNENLF